MTMLEFKHAARRGAEKELHRMLPEEQTKVEEQGSPAQVKTPLFKSGDVGAISGPSIVEL